MKRQKVNPAEVKEIQSFKYGIIAAKQTAEDEKNGEISIVHYCGYPKKPRKADYKSLMEELNTDPEFGLIGRMGKDVFLMEATPDMVKHFTNSISIIDSHNE